MGISRNFLIFVCSIILAANLMGCGTATFSLKPDNPVTAEKAKGLLVIGYDYDFTGKPALVTAASRNYRMLWWYAKGNKVPYYETQASYLIFDQGPIGVFVLPEGHYVMDVSRGVLLPAPIPPGAYNNILATNILFETDVKAGHVNMAGCVVAEYIREVLSKSFFTLSSAEVPWNDFKLSTREFNDAEKEWIKTHFPDLEPYLGRQGIIPLVK